MKHVLINVETKYCDVKPTDLDEALKWLKRQKDKGEALSIGLVGNAVDIHKAILDKGFKIRYHYRPNECMTH